MAQQLDKYLKSNKLHNPMQSAYRKYLSAETAMLMVYNDIVKSLDDGKFAVLLQLVQTQIPTILFSRTQKKRKY